MRGPTKNHVDDLASVGAECHADADLVGAAGDVVGGDTIEPDGGQQEGEQAEESREPGDEALLVVFTIDLLTEACYIEHG